MRSLEKAFEIIKAYEEVGDFVGPVDRELIKDAEDQLKVTFPKSYCEFIEVLGTGDIFGEEIYGLGIPANGIPSVIWITHDLRKNHQLPINLVPIYNTGYDFEYICIDCTNVKGSDEDYSPMVVFRCGDENDEELEIVNTNFGDFLYQLLEEARD